MISFYPGPSRVYKQIPAYVKDAYEEGILSINHRSKEFIELCSATQNILRKRLNIPADYMIFFTSSATECWEIIAQSFPETYTYHFYNGSFGEKWLRYTQKLKQNVVGYQFNYENLLDFTGFDLSGEEGIICLTQNETSNGTQLPIEDIKLLRSTYPDHLIAVDATSSLGGLNLPIDQADIWFASVQKCFGLPAGMGIMICSAKTMKKVLSINEKSYYNSMVFMREMMKDYQTTYTPNVLSIYLLLRTQENCKSIKKVDAKLEKRAAKWYKFLEEKTDLKPLIKNKKIRSKTVIAVKHEKSKIAEIKDKAKAEGIIVGNGYGQWKNETFRIANFPAIKKKEIKLLKNLLKNDIK
ncbi:MAG: aminotransferase class V-fold PLP-dependent enzyme [Candidatus Cyclobacteriaceae bacterium M2_1C_046]